MVNGVLKLGVFLITLSVLTAITAQRCARYNRDQWPLLQEQWARTHLCEYCGTVLLQL